MPLLHIIMAAWLFLSLGGPGVLEDSVSKEESDFLNAAYSRVAVAFAEQERAEKAEIADLLKTERWASQRLEDASSERRSANTRLNSVAADQNHGMSTREESPAWRAAEQALARAEQREDQARADFSSRKTAREAAVRMAKESSEKRRADQLELKRLQAELQAQPSR